MTIHVDPRIRKALTDNWGIKLLSLGLSLTLWLYVTSKGKTELTLRIPLELRNVPQGMAVVGDVAGSMEVRLQGQERALRDITTGKKVVGIIDLTMARVGENTIRISPDDIRRPSGVAVTYLSLPEVRLRLERLEQKSFRLRPLLHGQPAEGYRVGKISVTPLRITVEGPISVLKTLKNLHTMPIDIEGASENMTVEPKIDYQGKQVKIIDRNISVRITLERAHT